MHNQRRFNIKGLKDVKIRDCLRFGCLLGIFKKEISDYNPAFFFYFILFCSVYVDNSVSTTVLMQTGQNLIKQRPAFVLIPRSQDLLYTIYMCVHVCYNL